MTAFAHHLWERNLNSPFCIIIIFFLLHLQESFERLGSFLSQTVLAIGLTLGS